MIKLINEIVRTLQKLTPRTLLLWSSSNGDQVQIPITFGITISIPPPIPDFAGKPTYNIALIQFNSLRGNIILRYVFKLDL